MQLYSYFKLLRNNQKLIGGVMMGQEFPNAAGWELPVLTVLCLFNVVCVIAIVKWKKWGFWGFCLVHLKELTKLETLNLT